MRLGRTLTFLLGVGMISAATGCEDSSKSTADEDDMIAVAEKRFEPTPLRGFDDVAPGLMHGWIDSGGVKIHYVTYGKGDPVIMVHGSPDFWYTWRDLIKPIGDLGHRVVAIDMRGFNLSDAPDGPANYDIKVLVGDIAAAIRAFGGKATLVAHDFGGFATWNLLMSEPLKPLVTKAVVLNMLHPLAGKREIGSNPDQQKVAEYARQWQTPGFAEQVPSSKLAEWLDQYAPGGKVDPSVKAKYITAFDATPRKTFFNLYTQNYPPPPYQPYTPPVTAPDSIMIKAPTLFVFGMDDHHQVPVGLKGTEGWVQKLTLLKLAGAGHFVQYEAPDAVKRGVLAYLQNQPVDGAEIFENGEAATQ